MKLIKKQKGQTLLEVVVAIGVAMIIIGSLVTLMNASNRRSTLARQATQASKLAQEGMEIVRNIRDRGTANTIVGFPAPCNDLVNGVDTWDELYTCSAGTVPSPAVLDVTARLEGPPWILNRPAPVFQPEAINLSGATFRRRVQVSDNQIFDTDGVPGVDSICSSAKLSAAQTKRVTVTVEWDSPIGTQERSTTTCLTRWRE